MRADPASELKRKQTCLSRYGAINAFQSPKTKETVLARYGVSNVFQAPVIQDIIRSTMKERLGVQFPLQSSDVRTKMQATMVDRYGVPYALQSPDIRANIDFHAAWEKRHERAKAEKGYGTRTSKEECRFYDELVRLYGTENVERHVLMDGHSIDFFVKSVDTYVQFDGLYWHGLDRPYELLSKKRQHGYDQDRRQDRWFAEQGLRLVRVTSDDFKQGTHVKKLSINVDY